MDDNHLSHSTWDCKYHLVFASKYRMKRLYGELRRELGEQFRAEAKANPDAWLDLDRFALKGVTRVDRYTYRIRLHGKYPQFVYWLAMPFFAPVPREADRFYAQPGMAEKNLTLD